MNSIKISIITSLYRCSEFLEQYLFHVSRITNLAECEVILVHNDPTTEELAILDNCVDKPIHLVHLRVPREGLYTSWNRAIQVARGKYLAIWNVDDIRTPDSLAAQRDALDNSDGVMCYGDFFGTRRYGIFPDKLYQYQPYAQSRKEALKRHIIGCFPMWRKDLHDTVGYFDEQFRLVSDYEFQLRVASGYPLVKADALLGYYLEYVGHKLSSNRKLQQKERTAVELRYRQYDRLLIHVLPFISTYRINSIRNFGQWIDITAIIPGLRRLKLPEMLSLLRMPFAYTWWFVKRSANAVHHRLTQ
ncbi:glycosyltransferase [Paraflavitalea sp. CAU 1676]|uniref:glycosyltransferase n=1 Tax=Paraflavitalea sp. CAU 1676 TaxID=3032598 RepID=UPI0023DCAC8E|nr:glycosyltransferase [Paraflavitalea sp. CAU 1676]MDF2188455.1 glycosyltransferase [Paraflavitalea sp. CAU 1676]